MTEHITDSEAECVACFHGVSLGLAGSCEGAVVAADVCVLDVIEWAVANHGTEGADVLVGVCGLAVDDEAFEVVVGGCQGSSQSHERGGDQPHLACAICILDGTKIIQQTCKRSIRLEASTTLP